MLKKMKRWFAEAEYENAIYSLGRIEKRGRFIDPFFVGESAYDYELKKWNEEKNKAKARVERSKAALARFD